MDIREAKVEDIKRIQELNLMLFKQDYEFDKSLNLDWPYSEAGADYSKKRINSEKALVLIAEDASKVIGYMIFNFTKTHDYLRPDICTVELENTYIEESYRRAGIGTEMYKMAEKWAKENGGNMMLVIANAENYKAHDFYEKMGLHKTDIAFQKEI